MSMKQTIRTNKQTDRLGRQGRRNSKKDAKGNKQTDGLGRCVCVSYQNVEVPN
jgi:hypothetical protein